MPTIECMHERMQPEHDYCPDCGETQTAESRVIRTLRTRAERAEAALRELGKHPESCGDDCVSELARQDALAELAALRAELQKVRSAAISGMDAATQHGHSLVQQAARLKAESNPDALESERAANALLTEQLQKAEADLATLRAERDALRAEVELWKERAYQLRFAMSEWQPIETAPRNGSYFLAWRAHAVMPQIVRWDITYDAAEDTFGDHVYHLTHWMPLPESPK